MAAYKSTDRWQEDGYGVVVDVVIVADSYEGVFTELATAIETGVYSVESTKEDLDLEAGVFAADDMAMTIDEMMISDAANLKATDAAAVNFALAAQNPATPRYVARVVHADGATITDAHYMMRGRIRPEMTAEDAIWHGDDYDTVRTPRRTWKASAGTYEVEQMLNASLDIVMTGGELDNGETVDGIENDAAWKAAAVADRLGYFKEASGVISWDYAVNPPVLVTGPKQARWGSLVSLSDVLGRLLAEAAGDSLTINFEDTVTGMIATPARFVPFVADAGRQLRYVNRIVSGIPTPYRWMLDWHYLRAGGDAATTGSMYVSYANLEPRDEDREFSWRARYKTVAELLYEIAGSLGMYVKWSYDTATQITCRFDSREALVGGACYLRGPVSAALDVKPVITADEEKRRYTGSAWQYTREGADPFYIFDGKTFYASREEDAAPQGDAAGIRLPLTISPTWCLMDGLGDDAGYALGHHYGMSWIPHGVVFTSDTARETRTDPEADPSWVLYNRAVVHSGMYIRCTGRDDDGSIGVTGEAIWAPVAMIGVKVDGVQRYYTRLADYRNAVTGRDGSFFATEYTMTVPGLNMFRSAPPGVGDTAGDWRNLTLGRVMTFDGVDYVVIGIERKRRETVLRLHGKARFAFTTPTLASPAEEPPATAARIDGNSAALPRTNVINAYRAAGTIAAGQAVAFNAAGAIVVARAHHDHYGRIAGIALADGVAGDDIPVQISGRVPDIGHGYDPGAVLYLRTGATSADPNITDVILDAKTATEDTVCRLGIAEVDGGLTLEAPPEMYVYYPPIADA